jgi:hypothetical protein
MVCGGTCEKAIMMIGKAGRSSFGARNNEKGPLRSRIRINNKDYLRVEF